MIMRREIGEKGQVVIPRDIRQMLGLKFGGSVVFEIKKDEVVLRQEQNPEEYLRDFLNVPRLKGRLSIKDIKKTIMEQYGKKIS